MTRRQLFLGSTVATGVLRPQEQQPPLDLGVKFKVEVEELGPIIVDVRERQLKLDCRNTRGVAANLQKSDLRIIQNSVNVPVERMYPVDERDVDIAFIFDTSSSQNSVLGWQGRDAQSVFQKLPRPKDRWFLTVVGNNFIQVGGWQESAHLMNRSAYTAGAVGQTYRYADPSTGTPLFDAVVHTVESLANISNRRKAVVMFTDGIDVGSNNARNYAATRILEEDVALYIFRYLDLGFYRQCVNQAWWYPEKPQEIINFAANANGLIWNMQSVSLASLVEQINVELRREYRVAYKLGDLEEPLGDPKVVFTSGDARLARMILFQRQPLFRRPRPRP